MSKIAEAEAQYVEDMIRRNSAGEFSFDATGAHISRLLMIVISRDAEIERLQARIAELEATR